MLLLKLLEASKLLAKVVLSLFMLAAALSANAQVCASPGLDGPAALSGVINTYHAGSGTAGAGTNQVTVASVTGQRTSARSLAVGDLVIVMQMQDSTTPVNAGKYEYAQVASIAGAVLTLNRALTNTYVQSITASGAGATTAWRTFQVVRVPQYANANVAAGNTVSSDAWTVTNANGGQGTGGIVALDVAGTTTVTGIITVDGAGFRGGAGFVSGGSRAGGTFTDADYAFTNGNGAFKGEGTVGTPFQVFDGTASALIYATATFGQGYALGASGQGPQGNAAGGGNDGDPPLGNQFNGGGGGGGNVGAGGQGGNSWTRNNAAGGKGGTATVNSASSLILGGGGGAGSNNNGSSTNVITLTPPNPAGRTLPPAYGAANGASGFISSSGAPGGGLVLLRTGNLAASAGVITARGYDAYNVETGSDGAGGGGAGGGILVTSAAGNGAGLTLNAAGGGGGYSNYYDHGPGGGGGGGYIATSANLTSVVSNVAGGALGYDACCGGGTNGLAKPYSSAGGTGGLATTAAGGPVGVGTGSACLPQLTVTKSTTTPTVTLPGGTTAQYSINVSNAITAGAAYGVSIRDVLPAPFGLQTVAATASTVFSGTNTSGLSPTSANQSGNTTTAVFGVAGTGNVPTVSSFTLFPGGSVTVTFVVNVNSAALGATFQNNASATFTDPTRATGGAANSSSLSNSTVTSGGIYASGAAVVGTNYLSSSSTAEDVTVVATTSLSVTKTNAVTTVTSGTTTSYTVTFTNNGGYAANNALIKDVPSTGLACNSVTCASTTGGASCPTGLVLGTATPAASVPNLFNGTGITISTFPAASSVALTVVCTVTAAGQ